MNISFADTLYLFSGLIIFGGGVICLGVGLYLGLTKGEELSGYFKNSSSLITVSAHPQSGMAGKVRLVWSIASVLTFPNFYIKHGMLNPEDFAHFPPTLKRKLVVLEWSLIGVLLGMTVLSLWAMVVRPH
jgi:hypothetical protein